MEAELRNLCETPSEPGKGTIFSEKCAKNIPKTIELFENFTLLKMEKDMLKFPRNANRKHR
jgi:hypothetical protein